MLQGQKHLVRCRCVLPQFKRSSSPPAHCFAVFSVLDNDQVRAKFVQCPNCSTVHRVTELGKSEILAGKESLASVVTIDDLRSSVPERLAAVLESHGADVATWEQAQFIIDNKEWGAYVVLASESEGGFRHGKYVRILGEGVFKVETFAREEVIR